MGIEPRIDDCSAQVVGGAGVVLDRVALVPRRLHGIRRCALFREVHDRVRTEPLQQIEKQLVVLGNVDIGEVH